MHSVQAFRALPAGHGLRGGSLCIKDLPKLDSQVVPSGRGCPFVHSVCAISWRAIGNGERRLFVSQHSSGTSSRSFSGQVRFSGTRAVNHLGRRTSLGQLGDHLRRPKSYASGPWEGTENLLGRGKSLLVRASSQQPEEEFPEDGDYALPPLDLDELTGGRASKERAKKAKQDAADAQLLQAWDSSSLAKKSLYDMLGTGASGGGMKEYTGWKPVDPAEYLTKIGIYDTEGENFPESASAAANWDVDAVGKSRAPSGQDADFGREGTKRKGLGVRRQPSSGLETTRRKPGVVEERGQGSGAASVSGRGSKPSQTQRPAREAQPGNGVRKGMRPPPRSKATRKEVEIGGYSGTQFTASELSVKDVPGGVLSDLPLESTPGFSDQLGIGLPPKKAGQEQEAWSLDQWDLGLPDYELVKEFSKQAPPTVSQTPNVSDGLESLAMPSEFRAERRQPGLGAEVEVLEEGNEGYEAGARDLALSMEEVKAKARAIAEILGGRRGGVSRGVEDAANYRGPEMRTENGGEGARKAPEVDDDSLLAQFDKMMASKASGLPMQPYGVRILDEVSEKQGPGGADEEMAFWESQKRGGGRRAELEEGDEEDLGEEDEALRRAEEVLRGKMGSGLIPQAKARLEAAERLGLTAGEEDEEDEEEEIEEQFIQVSYRGHPASHQILTSTFSSACDADIPGPELRFGREQMLAACSLDQAKTTDADCNAFPLWCGPFGDLVI
jgi:hypothetical protein